MKNKLSINSIFARDSMEKQRVMDKKFANLRENSSLSFER